MVSLDSPPEANLHLETASSAALSRIGLPPLGSTDFTSPSDATTAITLTVPPRFIFLASSGYVGGILRRILRPLSIEIGWFSAVAAGARQHEKEKSITKKCRVFTRVPENRDLLTATNEV